MAKKKPSKKTIIKAITEKEGNVSAAARKLNMNRCTLITWINKDEELKQVVEDERETIVDEIEDVLIKGCRNGDVTAIKFFLKTTGRILRPEKYDDRPNINTDDPEEFREAVRDWLKLSDEADITGEKPE